MAITNRKLKVGLLALTLEFYESDPGIRRGREEWIRNAVVPALKPHAQVLFHGACFRREQIEQEVARLEHQGAEVLLVICATYATSLSSLPALQRTRLPIVVWNTQELHGVTESYGTRELIANHGVHGTFDLCNVLSRSGVRFGYVTSHLSDPGAMQSLASQLRGAAGVTWLRRMRLGLLGYPFPGMGDFGLDTTRLCAELGCAVEALAMSDYQQRVQATAARKVAALAAEYRRTYRVAADVKGSQLDATARAELALRSMVEDFRLDAYSYQFLAFGQDPQAQTVPFVAACRLMADGIGFGGEGDLIAAAFATMLHRLSTPATFTEIFTIDFAGNGLLLSHMGEANAAMAPAGKLALRRRSQIVPTTHGQLALPMTFRPGPATLAALTIAHGGRWRILASPVAIVDFGPLPQSETPHAKATVAGDVRDWLTAYATAGGPHHMAMCFGSAMEQLELLAHLIGADFVDIAKTSARHGGGAA